MSNNGLQRILNADSRFFQPSMPSQITLTIPKDNPLRGVSLLSSQTEGRSCGNEIQLIKIYVRHGQPLCIGIADLNLADIFLLLLSLYFIQQATLIKPSDELEFLLAFHMVLIDLITEFYSNSKYFFHITIFAFNSVSNAMHSQKKRDHQITT